MRIPPFLALAAFLVAPAAAQTRFTSDLQVTGQVGVGTAVPRARAELRQGTSDAYILRVSSPDATFLMGVEKNGRVGIGVSAAAAKVDVRGTGDAGDIGLLLRAGNSSSTVSASQLVFVYDGTGTYRHSLRTRHAAGQEDYNAMDFYLWRGTDAPNALGDRAVLSLQAVTSVSSGSFHVNPVGLGFYELEVSSGAGIIGGGTMVRASAGTHSSRVLKTDIEPLTAERTREGFEAVKSLKHVTFRYKMPGGRAEGVLRRGLIFEEAPPSIQGKGKTLVVDQRVLNLELTLQEVQRRVESVEREVEAREKRR